MSILHGILALLGLGFLIFIHELGHYWVARRVGMKVEVFSIGFGRPIWVWYRGDVKWQICWLPFGGYVKMAGMDTQDDVDPRDVEGGFWAKRPLDRILVLFAGPGANFLFAIVVFTLLWGMGGRTKPFSELTHHVGWIDPKSELYEKGLRPGDKIDAYNGHPFRGYRDHVYAAVLDDQVTVDGEHVNLEAHPKEPFSYEVTPYYPENQGSKGVPTIGVQEPARFLLFSSGTEDLAEASPMAESGLEDGDRVVWVDGQVVMSLQHLNHVINSTDFLITIQRGEDRLQMRVPSYSLKEMVLEDLEGELSDWQYAAGLKDQKLRDLRFMAYNLTPAGEVENSVELLNPEEKPVEEETILKPGDRVIAVQGTPVATGPQIMAAFQKKKVNLVVQKDGKYGDELPLEAAEKQLVDDLPREDLRRLLQGLGSANPVREMGELRLIGPVEPITRQEFWTRVKGQEAFQEQYEKQRQAIADVEDPELRGRAMELLKTLQQQYMLGISLGDRKVNYNPPPQQMFGDVMTETLRTFVSLVTGNLRLQWMSGPVGIVQVIQVQVGVGLKEALYWLAFISVNLAVLNLLPIPVLDGGYIFLSLVEMVTGRRLQAKTIERLVIPFAILLIMLFVYLTLNDISRIFGGLW